jgi:hypothetical protein
MSDSEERIVLMEMHADKVEQLRQLRTTCAEKDAEIARLIAALEFERDPCRRAVSKDGRCEHEARATAAEQRRRSTSAPWENCNCKHTRWQNVGGRFVCECGAPKGGAPSTPSPDSPPMTPQIAAEMAMAEVLAADDIVNVLTKRFARGYPGSGLSMSCMEAHALLDVLRRPSTPSPAPSAEGEP